MAGVCPLDAYVLMVLDKAVVLWVDGAAPHPGLRVLGGGVPAGSPGHKVP